MLREEDLEPRQEAVFDGELRDGKGQMPACVDRQTLEQELLSFAEFGTPTLLTVTDASILGEPTVQVPTYVNEFWTSRQRVAHSLHEISYRACFKPQLPRFFVERLTAPGDYVYDPFMGRGTTLLEAALLRRVPVGCDVNPLSALLLAPRLCPPTVEDVEDRLNRIPFDATSEECPEGLLVFYHPQTLRAICSLKTYLMEREHAGLLDAVDSWIRMVAVNRLSGHSPGFFSVYTMPPNQAVSLASQRIINERRGQTPPVRDVPKLILAKTRSLLKDCDIGTRELLRAVTPDAQLLTALSSHTPAIPAGSVSLVVTSPPFLDVVDYAGDNWLRCWFCGIDPADVRLTVVRRLEEWKIAMTQVFVELERVLRPSGHVAFEVGEVRRGKLKLEESVILCGQAAGLSPRLVLINDQTFTKTANCWGVQNGRNGTNTNRIVLFRKDGG